MWQLQPICCPVTGEARLPQRGLGDGLREGPGRVSRERPRHRGSEPWLHSLPPYPTSHWLCRWAGGSPHIGASSEEDRTAGALQRTMGGQAVRPLGTSETSLPTSGPEPSGADSCIWGISFVHEECKGPLLVYGATRQKGFHTGVPRQRPCPAFCGPQVPQGSQPGTLQSCYIYF